MTTMPDLPEPCLTDDGRCWSPTACAAFGCCRQRLMLETHPTEHRLAELRQIAAHRKGLVGRSWTIADFIGLVTREIAHREKTYPRWVRDGKMKAQTADYQLEGARALQAYLVRQRNHEEGR